jgi:hypothetical protein
MVGVLNKFFTVLLNVLVWDKHSSGFGLFAVGLCLLSGVFYQQAPRRDELHRQQTAAHGKGAAAGEEESSLLGKK